MMCHIVHGICVLVIASSIMIIVVIVIVVISHLFVIFVVDDGKNEGASISNGSLFL